MQRRLSAGATPALLLALALLAACGAPDEETDARSAPDVVRILPGNEAVSGAHIPTLDPMTMVDAEILKVLGPGPRCEFRYTSAGKPVLAARPSWTGDAADGVLKVNGHLVALSHTSAEGGGLVFADDKIRVTLRPENGERSGSAHQREADVVFEIGDSLRAGYRGYYLCIE